MITKFDKSNLAALRVAITTALANVEKETGVKINLGVIRFGATDASAKLEFLAASSDGTARDPKAEAFLKAVASGDLPGFTAADLGRSFNATTGHRYTVTGYKPRSPAKPLVIEDSRGEVYSATVEFVRSGFARAAQLTPATPAAPATTG